MSALIWQLWDSISVRDTKGLGVCNIHISIVFVIVPIGKEYKDVIQKFTNVNILIKIT